MLPKIGSNASFRNWRMRNFHRLHCRTPHVDQTPQIDKDKWVINLSSRPLSDAVVSLLEKELNLFAVTPMNIPATEIVAKVESAIRTLDSERADTLRRSLKKP